eukprot:scaffold4566_cov118-Isochrysis_galbana.AAC.7
MVKAETPTGATGYTVCPQHGCRFVCLRRKAEVFLVGDVEEFVKQASAGLQATAGCRLHRRIELASKGPPGFARRSRGGDARHLKQSGCCGDDGVVKIKVCPGPMGRREVVHGHARQRVRHR